METRKERERLEKRVHVYETQGETESECMRLRVRKME